MIFGKYTATQNVEENLIQNITISQIPGHRRDGARCVATTSCAFYVRERVGQHTREKSITLWRSRMAEVSSMSRILKQYANDTIG
jgi:hypothetical protein